MKGQLSEACISRFRIFLEMLYNEMTWDEILEQHAILERDDIKAAMFFAVMNLSKIVTLRAS